MVPGGPGRGGGGAGRVAARGAAVRGTRYPEKTLGAPLPPAHPDGYGRTLAAIRAALGDDGFAAEHAAGEGLSPEGAFAAASTARAADDEWRRSGARVRPADPVKYPAVRRRQPPSHGHVARWPLQRHKHHRIDDHDRENQPDQLGDHVC
jgi:hypothetical protein